MQEQQIREQNNHRLHQLGKFIDSGEKVLQTVQSDGWKNIIEPVLNKMIVDVVGGIENGRWHNGSLDDKRLGEERLKSLCAYKRALTDFHKYIYQFVDSLPGYKAEFEEIVMEESFPDYDEVETGYKEEE